MHHIGCSYFEILGKFSVSGYWTTVVLEAPEVHTVNMSGPKNRQKLMNTAYHHCSTCLYSAPDCHY